MELYFQYIQGKKSPLGIFSLTVIIIIIIIIIIKGKGTGKIHPITSHEGPEGE
jgi:hypothetical protein